jgi:stearoyl-CoA desaturase (Delta-9 desaturase)
MATTAAPAERHRLNPVIVIPYVALHLSCLGAFYTGVSWKALAICAGSFYLRMIGLGIGYHRYFAHRAFKTSRPMQLFLALLGVLTVQRGPLWWARTHREHHRHTDTPQDLHSPKHTGFFYSHWGWFMNPDNFATEYARVGDLARYPELVALDKGYVHHPLIALYVVGLYQLWGWTGVVWGFSISTVLLLTVSHLIQSMSHLWGGYRWFDNDDESRNHWLLGVLSLGEWHHNHHYQPGSARQGMAWWEIDVNYYLLRLLERLGLVWDLRVPPEDVMAKAGAATAR